MSIVNIMKLKIVSKFIRQVQPTVVEQKEEK